MSVAVEGKDDFAEKVVAIEHGVSVGIAAVIAVIAIIHAGFGVVIRHESLHRKDGQVAKIGEAGLQELERDFAPRGVVFPLVFQFLLAQAHTVRGSQSVLNFRHVLEQEHFAVGHSADKAHPHHAEAFLVEVFGHAFEIDFPARFALQSADNHQVSAFVETEHHAAQGGIGNVLITVSALQVARGRIYEEGRGNETLVVKLLGGHHKAMLLSKGISLEQNKIH